MKRDQLKSLLLGAILLAGITLAGKSPDRRTTT